MLFPLCLVVAMATVHAVPLATLQPVASHCEHNGVILQVGEKDTSNPCMPCFCSQGGQMACAIIDCMMPMCVDAVRAKDQCCSTCPNGPNCRHGNVTIAKGDTYQVDAHTTCYCQDSHGGFGFFNPGLEATCVKSVA